jgi:hypothetical protein
MAQWFTENIQTHGLSQGRLEPSLLKCSDRLEDKNYIFQQLFNIVELLLSPSNTVLKTLCTPL